MSDEGIREILKSNPGDPRFPEYGALLVGQGRLDEALSVILAGLSSNPSNHRARILLSRIFYEKGFLPFSVRELEVLQLELADNKYLRRLLERLAPDRLTRKQELGVSTANQSSQEETLAEVEFDIDEIENIDKD